MALQKLPLDRVKYLQNSTLALAVSLTLGGCAINKVGVNVAEKATPTAQTPISLISQQEEQLLYEATERANRLHAQMRELEARNVKIVSKLSPSAPKAASNDRKLATSKKVNGKVLALRNKLQESRPAVSITERLEPVTKFKVEFARGSFLLDDAKIAALVNNLNNPDPTVKKIGTSGEARFVIEVATYEKFGIDSVNRGRLKTIADALKLAGVEPDVVKFKIIRVGSKLGSPTMGSASRLVRITRLETPLVQS